MNPFGTASVAHLAYAVDDVAARAAQFATGFGFAPVDPTPGRPTVLRQGGIAVVVTDRRPEFVRRHGDGIADIALRVDDVPAAFAAAVAGGATAVRPPRAGGTAAVRVFGDVTHTLVPDGKPPGGPTTLVAVDHIAVCLPAGQLDPTVAVYQAALGFDVIYEERIVVGDQAMMSRVVQNAAGSVTLTLIEPDPAGAPGQIQAFLDGHGGAGVQHVAFSTNDIVAAVAALRRAGTAFLDAPPAYYDVVGARVTPAAHPMAALRAYHILVDEDHGGQLFQIFTASAHPRRTLFFELIERVGARTFGSGNIRALYQAVEQTRRSRAGRSVA